MTDLQVTELGAWRERVRDEPVRGQPEPERDTARDTGQRDISSADHEPALCQRDRAGAEVAQVSGDFVGPAAQLGVGDACRRGDDGGLRSMRSAARSSSPGTIGRLTA